METPPGSLRDTYQRDASSSWTFALESPQIPNSTSQVAGIPVNSRLSTSSVARAQAPATLSGKSSDFEWSTRSNSRYIFDLSASSDPSGVDTISFLKSLAASAVLQYASATIAMPWEVAKLLLQVQWIPRDAGDDEGQRQEVIEDVETESSDDSNDESYFADPGENLTKKTKAERAPQKEGRFVQRRRLEHDSPRPEYIIPVGSADGVWSMIKRIGRFRGEGWMALWKGLLTFYVHDALFATLQPFFESLFSAIFHPSRLPYEQTGLFLPIASHVLAGFILSPLDLVRTRLIIQSFSPSYRTYSGPIDALTQIIRHEGGIRDLYLHPHLLIPTLIDQTLRPLVSLALPSIFASYFGTHVTPLSHPVGWGLAEFAGNCAGLLITLPFETVRRRLQAQVRGNGKPIKACVELRPNPYVGTVDTLYRIVSEERSDLPIRLRRMHNGKKDPREEMMGESWLRSTGIGQLYRGLGMRLGASLIVFVLVTLSGREENPGWAEL